MLKPDEITAIREAAWAIVQNVAYGTTPYQRGNEILYLLEEKEKETRHAAMVLVDVERDRQDAKWGEQNHSPSVWTGILGEEYGEYCLAVNETVFDNGPIERAKGGQENMLRELAHVAAVAVAAMECLMRDPVLGGEETNEAD